MLKEGLLRYAIVFGIVLGLTLCLKLGMAWCK